MKMNYVATAMLLLGACGAENERSVAQTVSMPEVSSDLNLEKMVAENEAFDANMYQHEEPNLTETELSTKATVYAPLANLIARRASNQNAGRSLGQCWKYANDAVTGRGGARMGMYAVQFPSLYSEANMKNLFGLCHLRGSNGAKILNVQYAPVGSVIGYAPGMHGFSSKWGHGEIKVSSSRYCSDFCANRGSFAASMILVPCAKGAYNNLR